MTTSSARIIAVPSTLRAGRHGPATADIWIVLDDVPFPAEHWNDFVVVILGWWAGALLNILRGKSLRERVSFMDGPHGVEVIRASEHDLELRAIDDHLPPTERARAITPAKELAHQVVAAAEAILATCRERQCWSRDADTLQALVAPLRAHISTLPG